MNKLPSLNRTTPLMVTTVAVLGAFLLRYYQSCQTDQISQHDRYR